MIDGSEKRKPLVDVRISEFALKAAITRFENLKELYYDSYVTNITMERIELLFMISYGPALTKWQAIVFLGRR